MLNVKSVDVSQGGFSAIYYRGCDGFPAARCFDVVYVKTADGREWYMPNGRKIVDEEGEGAVATYDPARLAERVRARGTIEPQYWIEVEVRAPGEIPDWATPEYADRERVDALMFG